MDGILILRNIPDDLLRALGRDAAAHGRTVEEEALARLRAGGTPAMTDWTEFERLRDEIRRDLGGTTLRDSVQDLDEARAARPDR